MPDLVSCAAGDRLAAGQVYRLTVAENWRATFLPGSQLVETYNGITTLVPGVYPISEPPLEGTSIAVIDAKIGPSAVNIGTVAQLLNAFALLTAVNVVRAERLSSQRAATPEAREQVRTAAEVAQQAANPFTRIFSTAKTVTYVAVGGVLLVGGVILYGMAKKSGLVK